MIEKEPGAVFVEQDGGARQEHGDRVIEHAEEEARRNAEVRLAGEMAVAEVANGILERLNARGWSQAVESSEEQPEMVKSTLLNSLPGVVQASSTLCWGTMRMKGADGAPLPEAMQKVALANRQRFIASLGLDWEKTVWMEQVHGGEIAVVREQDLQLVSGTRDIVVVDGDAVYEQTVSGPLFVGADGLITEEKDIALACLASDCLPVCCHDLSTGLTAVAHAGWKGIVRGILPNVLQKMQQMGANPETTMASIGPAIGGCCYEVSRAADQRVGMFKEITPSAVHMKGEKAFLSLQNAARRQLFDCGISPLHLEISGLCTCCRKSKFPSSYRSNYLENKPGQADSMLTVVAARRMAA